MRENISSPPQDPLERMLLPLNGHCLEQALYVAAVLGIADLLVGGNKSSSELATCTGQMNPRYIDCFERSPVPGSSVKTRAVTLHLPLSGPLCGTMCPTRFGIVPCTTVRQRCGRYGATSCIASGQESPHVRTSMLNPFTIISQSIRSWAYRLIGI